MKKILVFGTFDELHTGHLFFLRSAKNYGKHLTVAVARDEHVKTLKHKQVIQTEQVRLQTIKKLSFIDNAVLSDEQLGSFQIVDRIAPDLILLGHDQDELHRALQDWMNKTDYQIPIEHLEKFSFDRCLNCTCFYKYHTMKQDLETCQHGAGCCFGAEKQSPAP